MRRLITVLAVTVALGATAAAPAQAASAKRPQLGDWTCASPDGGAVPFATLDLFKGNKYAANGDTEKAKYVYKTGQHKLKFKTGIWADTFYGTYDKDAATITLVNLSDDTVASTCTHDPIHDAV